MNEEQTASLETALLHGHCGLVYGPKCEPLSVAEARGSVSAGADWDGPKGRSSATPQPARPILCRVGIDDSSHQRLVELPRCRSDLSLASSGLMPAACSIRCLLCGRGRRCRRRGTRRRLRWRRLCAGFIFENMTQHRAFDNARGRDVCRDFNTNSHGPDVEKLSSLSSDAARVR